MNKTGLYRACNWCGKEYYVHPYRVDESKFCSSTCMYQGRTERSPEGAILNCEHCGKGFYVTQGRKDTARFCSQRCSGLSTSQLRGVITHGMTGSPEHRCWEAMKARCAPTGEYHKSGISVCEEWRNDFVAFYNFMGPRPSLKHSLDRYPNAQGNYEPGNVRWASPKEQGWSKVGKPKSQHFKKTMSARMMGSQNPFAKLTEDDVREIRSLELTYGTRKQKQKYLQELAARFGISYQYVRDLQRRIAWSWLE